MPNVLILSFRNLSIDLKFLIFNLELFFLAFLFFNFLKLLKPNFYQHYH